MSDLKLPKTDPVPIEPTDRDSQQLPQPEVADRQFADELDSDTDPDRSPSGDFPQQRRWLWILGAILAIGGAGLSWRSWQASRANNVPPSQAGKPPAVSVKLATVMTKTVRDSSVFVGTLEAPRFVTIKPQIEGRINQIYIKEGDRVEQGQPIVNLQSDGDRAVLQQRQAALAQSQANLALLKAGTRPEQIAQARATLAQAQAKLRDAQSGAQPQEIDQAVAQIDSAQSTLDLATSRATRYQQLAQQGAVSRDLYDGYVKEQRNAQSALIVAQKKLAQLRQSRSSDISALSATVRQQQQNLRQQLNGSRPQEIAQARSQVSQAVAQVRAAQVQLQYTKVLAPFTGIVGNIPVKVGEYAAKGDALTTLTKNDSFDLNLPIPLDRVKQLRSGLPVELLDATGKSIAIGRVSFIAPTATADSQTILAKASFANNGQLLNHQSVQAKTIWSERPGILIPVTAVSRLGGKTFVFVAAPGKQSSDGNPSLIAQQQPVDLGAIEGNNYQVVKGLKLGDKIVISGLLNLTNGVPIVDAPAQTNTQKNP
jgi:RND family efflux transporter MFP subunit